MNPAVRRAVGGAELLLGAATLVRPRRTVTVLTGGRGAVPDLRVVRVLGARQVVQGAVMTMQPTAGVFAAAALVDVLHAASLLPVIALSRRHRAAASVSALLAGAFSAASTAQLR